MGKKCSSACRAKQKSQRSSTCCHWTFDTAILRQLLSCREQQSCRIFVRNWALMIRLCAFTFQRIISGEWIWLPDCHSSMGYFLDMVCALLLSMIYDRRCLTWDSIILWQRVEWSSGPRGLSSGYGGHSDKFCLDILADPYTSIALSSKVNFHFQDAMCFLWIYHLQRYGISVTLKQGVVTFHVKNLCEVLAVHLNRTPDKSESKSQ